MPEDQSIIFNREQLYNEIWEISLSGVAKKYNISYYILMKLCKEANIPVPSSGYWTKLSCGKSVSKTDLPDSPINEINLSSFLQKKSRKKLNPISENTENRIEYKGDRVSREIKDTEQLVYRAVNGQQNTYNRDILYEEVWQKPVSEVAIRYGVSDVTLHKVCKVLNIPVPYRGYWAKIRSGGMPSKTPLPPTNEYTESVGKRTFEAINLDVDTTHSLSFLSEEEGRKVFLAASKIVIRDENSQLHKKIRAYKSIVNEWNKKDKKQAGAKRSIDNYSNRPPFLAGVISNEALPRVYRFLDTIYREIESLGGTINDDLSLKIRNENVFLEISEDQDKIKHELTKKEAQDILIYEDAKRHKSWAYEPKFRKHDFVFNGRIKIKIRPQRYLKDTERVKIEDQLGELLIELYEQSEVERIDREAREEEARKKKEEERLREEKRNRYNQEIDLTLALENSAIDYDTACKIRALVKAVEISSCNNAMNEEALKWIEWAKNKADWFDPTIARDDELLGQREHENSQDQKTLKKKSWSFW